MFGKTVRIIFGSFLALFGAVGMIVGIIAIIDPIGSKMADDADPFGVLPTFLESLFLTLFYVLILVFGLNLISSFKWIRENLSNNKLK